MGLKATFARWLANEEIPSPTDWPNPTTEEPPWHTEDPSA